MVLLNEHGYCVGDESDGSQEEQDRDEADVWSGTGELEIGLRLVVSEVNSVHGNADWRTLLIDGVGSFVEWRRRALDECLVDVDGGGFTESAELASHARHAGLAGYALSSLLSVGLQSQWLEELASFGSLDVDLADATNFEGTRMCRVELWLVVESENVGGLGPWIELVARQGNREWNITRQGSGWSQWQEVGSSAGEACVREDLGFYDGVVGRCSESASWSDSRIISETLTLNNDSCDTANWSTVWRKLTNTVWSEHGLLGWNGVGVTVQGDSGWQRVLILGWKWHVLDDTSDLTLANVVGLTLGSSDLATKFS